jgi:hypothetical protein
LGIRNNFSRETAHTTSGSPNGSTPELNHLP